VKRCLAAVAVAFALGGCAAPAVYREQVDLHYFVGQRVSVERLDERTCAQSVVDADGGETCLIDRGWALVRVRNLDDLPGSGGGEEAFKVGSHGDPASIVEDTPMLLFVRTDGTRGPRLFNEEAYRVRRTVDGDWAGCGPLNPADEADPAAMRTEPLEFPADTHFGPARDTRIAAVDGAGNPTWREDGGGNVRCLRGNRVKDVVDYVMRRHSR
jgi:hypothetical protein